MPRKRRGFSVPALPPYRVRTAGHIYASPHHSTPGSREGDTMLTVFLAGRGLYILDRRRSAVEPGTVGLVPDENPGIVLSDAADPYDHYYCRFAGDYALSLAAGIRASHGGRFFHHERAAEIADLVRRMGPIGRGNLPGQVRPAELLLAEALMILSQPPRPARTRALSAESLEQYLRDHISEPFELLRVAEHFAVSRTSLCRAARRLTGRTLLEVAEELKVEWAGTLLASGAANVSEAARRTGYADPFYFSRVFRRRTGLAPREWAARGRR